MTDTEKRIHEIAEKIVENRKADLASRELDPTDLVKDLIDIIEEKKFKLFQEDQCFTDEEMEEVDFRETFDDFSHNYEAFKALAYLSKSIMVTTFRNADYVFESYDGIVELLYEIAWYLDEYAEFVL